MRPPLVAIVGRPNVGKSTLFNRLVGQRRAIVTEEPGATRDRLHAEVSAPGGRFDLVDTGGVVPGTVDALERGIGRQAERALESADLVLFVVDARAGATALDLDLAQRMRRRHRMPVLLVANKIDEPQLDSLTHDLYGLGLGSALPVSAEHGRGIAELLETIAELLGFAEAEGDGAGEPRDGTLRVAILGRPNVGKSSLFNRLVGEERALVSELPGTTRDAVDMLLAVGDRSYRLIDTAGLRRRGRAREPAERHSVSRAKSSLERCDVAILVLDGVAGFVAQDAHIAGYVLASRKPMVVAVNKWDLVRDREKAAKAWEARLRDRLRFAKQVPMLLVSAKSGQRVSRLLQLAEELHRAASIRVPTAELNRWLASAVGAGPSGRRASGTPRFFYATQVGVHPPRFVVFCDQPRRVHFSLRRRLENSLRDRYGFGGAPVQLHFRSRRSGPKA